MKKVNFTFSIIFVFLVLLSIQLPSKQPDKTWLTDITHLAGLDSARGARIWIVDVNNDNYPDLMWGPGGTNRNKCHLYLNIENPDKSSPIKRVFKDITDESGINQNRDTAKKGRVVDIACMADFNNDGYMDLFTSIYYHRLEYYNGTGAYADPGDRSEVLLNDGTGHFTLKKDAGVYNMNVMSNLPAGLINATGIGFLDYDYDGNLDIYISTWFSDRLNGIGMPDVLLKGKGDGSFTKINMPIIENNYYPEYGVNITDWDNDGWPDILTSPYCNSRGNLFRNMHDGTFIDYAVQANYNAQDMTGDNGQALCQWSAQPCDYNNDGNMDILQVLVHGGYDVNEGRTHISTNMGPDSGYKFHPDVTQILRDAPHDSHLGDQGGQWFDLDADGLRDVGVCQMAYPQANLAGQERFYICKQNDSGQFIDISKDLGIYYTIKEAHSVQPLDYDLDGDQDLLVSHQVRDTTWRDTVINGVSQKVFTETTHMQILLLQNNIGNQNNWSSVKVNPPAGANKSGIGTRLKWYSGKFCEMDEIQAGLGHFGGEEPFIRNVGMGQRHRIDSITARWPKKDLQTTVVRDIPMNTIFEIDGAGTKKIIKPTNDKFGVISFFKPILEFGSVDVGKSSVLNFDVENLGDSALTVDKISINSSLDNTFSFVNLQLPFVINPGDKKNVQVKFTPSIRKIYSGYIDIHSTAKNNPNGAIDIEAAGFEQKPMITSDNSILDFGIVYSDTTHSKDLIIKNSGELPLTINSVSIKSGGQIYSVKGFNQKIVLQANNTLSLSVSFKPVTNILYNDTILINSDAYNSPNYIIALTGTGRNKYADLQVITPAVLFGKVVIGNKGERSIYIKNAGDGDLIVSTFSYELPYDSIFKFINFNFPCTIYPNVTDTLTLQFWPAESKSYRTKLYLKSNSYDDTLKTISLNGTGYINDDVPETSISLNNLIVRVYPNPIENFATIDLEYNGLTSSFLSIKLFDAFGRLVKGVYNNSIEIGSQQIHFDASSFSRGLFFLEINCGLERKSFPIILE